jgi:hypothetical protein
MTDEPWGLRRDHDAGIVLAERYLAWPEASGRRDRTAIAGRYSSSVAARS